MRLNPLFTVLCLWIHLVLHVFNCLERIQVLLCPLQLLIGLICPYIQSKASRHSPTSPQLELCKGLTLSPDPKLVFPLLQRKPKKPKNKHTYLFTSLKSVLIVSHLASYCSFSRDWRRESSPVLVGLATRLSVVWCSLEFTSFQPEVDLSANIVATILGRNSKRLLVIDGVWSHAR